MYLIVDIGNSRAKLVIVEGVEVVYTTTTESISADIV